MNRNLKLVALATGAIVALTGCGNTHSDAPDPVDKNIVNGTNQHVIQEPDGYRNVSFSCFGKNGIYVTSRSNVDSLPSSVFVVVNDPQCN